MVEDAACAIGTGVPGRKTGDWADISAFSFYPRKFITTGEGGLVTTNRPEWAEWMDSYKHFGMRAQTTREDTVFGMVGTNYKLSNILAAVGCAQMRVIDMLLARRREQAARYVELLSVRRPDRPFPGWWRAARPPSRPSACSLKSGIA
jgi:perosamine synthetase